MSNTEENKPKIIKESEIKKKPEIDLIAKISSIMAMVICGLFSGFLIFLAVMPEILIPDLELGVFFYLLIMAPMLPVPFLFWYNIKFLRTGEGYIGAGIWALFSVTSLIFGILILIMGEDRSKTIATTPIPEEPTKEPTKEPVEEPVQQPVQPQRPMQPRYPQRPMYPGQQQRPMYPQQQRPMYPQQQRPMYPQQQPGQPQRPMYPQQPGQPQRPMYPQQPGQPQGPMQPGQQPPVQPQQPGQNQQPQQPVQNPQVPKPGTDKK